MNAKANATAVLDLKSAALTLIAVVLKTGDPVLVADELDRRFVDGPNPFDHDPVIIDLAALHDDPSPLALEAIVGLLAKHRMRAVAVRGGSAEQHEAARALGLGEAPEELPMPPRAEKPAEATAPAADDSRPATAAAAPEAPALEVESVVVPRPVGATTLLIDRPLRSGQQVYARGGDLVVLAAVSFGAEVIADGSIHVYGPLRGRAIAGARGYTEARIYSTVMEPQLISIAGIYRTTENPLAPEVVGKPAQVRLEGERLVVEPLRS